MKHPTTKVKITSFILGVIGASWIVSCVVSFYTLAAYEVLFRIGAGFVSFALAIEPSILFQSLPSSVKEAGHRPMPFTQPLIVAFSKGGQICMVLAGISWLMSLLMTS